MPFSKCVTSSPCPLYIKLPWLYLYREYRCKIQLYRLSDAILKMEIESLEKKCQQNNNRRIWDCPQIDLHTLPLLSFRTPLRFSLNRICRNVAASMNMNMNNSKLYTTTNPHKFENWSLFRSFFHSPRLSTIFTMRKKNTHREKRNNKRTYTYMYICW